MANVKREWFRNNSGFFTRGYTSADGVAYTKRAGHSEVVVSTNSSFSGSFSLSAVPDNADADSSSIGIWVDGVFNQTVALDVGANLNRQQTVTVNTGLSGVHTIRIQEGDRQFGAFLTQLAIDGTVVSAPAIVRQYTTFGDSVSMGVFGQPRSSGWANRMKGGGSRFDSVTNLGWSGYSLLQAVNSSGGLAGWVQSILPATANYVGSTENVVALCMGLNDWVTSVPDSSTAANYQTMLGNLCDLLIAAALAQGTPGFRIMIHSLTHIIGGLPGTANDKGSTPADFLAAAQAVATARAAKCTYLNVFNACTDADMVDLDHPNAVGHGKIYAVVQAAT